MGVDEKHKVDAANIKHAILNAKGFNIHPRTRQQPQKHDEPECESIRNSEIAAVVRNSTHDERYPGHVVMRSGFEFMHNNMRKMLVHATKRDSRIR